MHGTLRFVVTHNFTVWKPCTKAEWGWNYNGYRDDDLYTLLDLNLAVACLILICSRYYNILKHTGDGIHEVETASQRNGPAALADDGV